MDTLIFDIETVAHPKAEEWIEVPEPDLEAVKAPSNYKDEEKIAAYIEQKRQALLEEAEAKRQEKLDKAALDPDLGMVRAIAMGRFTSDPIVLLAPEDMSEPDLIRLFWNEFAAARGRAVGYNILGFDLPFLLRRSFDLGITPTIRPILARYRTEPITDLYAILYNWGPGKGLKWVCKRYGITNELPDVDGSMVATMTPDEIRAYAGSDLKLTGELYHKMKGIYF